MRGAYVALHLWSLPGLLLQIPSQEPLADMKHGGFSLWPMRRPAREDVEVYLFGNIVNKKVLHLVKEKNSKRTNGCHIHSLKQKNFATKVPLSLLRCKHRRMALGRKKTWHFQEFIILITSSFIITVPHHHKSDLGQLISPQKATFHALRWISGDFLLHRSTSYHWISRTWLCHLCTLPKNQNDSPKTLIENDFSVDWVQLVNKKWVFSLFWLYLWIFSNFVQVSIIVGIQPLAVPERQRLDSATQLSRIKLVKHTSWRILLNKKNTYSPYLSIYNVCRDTCIQYISSAYIHISYIAVYVCMHIYIYTQLWNHVVYLVISGLSQTSTAFLAMSPADTSTTVDLQHGNCPLSCPRCGEWKKNNQWTNE